MFQLEQNHQHQLGEVLGQHADQGQLNNGQGATLKKEKQQVQSQTKQRTKVVASNYSYRLPSRKPSRRLERTSTRTTVS